MTGLYLLLWGLIAARELPEIWRAGDRRAAGLWLATALGGLGLWWAYQDSAWRLSEWLLGWNMR